MSLTSLLQVSYKSRTSLIHPWFIGHGSLVIGFMGHGVHGTCVMGHGLWVISHGSRGRDRGNGSRGRGHRSWVIG